MTAEPDPLTEVLEVFPLPIRFAGRIELSAPWGLSVPERWAAVCAVTKGQCCVSARGSERSISVAVGDIVVLSPACGHELWDTSASRLVPIPRLSNGMWDQHRPVFSAGGGGPQTSLVAGVFHFDDAGADPFCCSLPPVVHLEKNDAGEAVLLEHIVGLIDHELTAGRPGMRGIVNRLVEILFLQAVRVPLAETCGESGGSIGGMLHPDLGTVLTLIHHQPERPWTVAELAEQATMSRSAFSATFVKVLGKPPLQYLRQRRMQLACRLLRNPRIGLREIAARVGYDSASAFSTAFKRFSGMAPGDYRRRETRSKWPPRSLPLRPAKSPCRSPE